MADRPPPPDHPALTEIVKKLAAELDRAQRDLGHGRTTWEERVEEGERAVGRREDGAA
jgi:hypothetical protein